MTDDCVQYEDDLAELALGVLTGRERARTLSHVESCPRCAEELEQLARAADAVVGMAPEAEPPLGFETRLFEKMGIEHVRPKRRRRPRYWIPATAAAAVAALADRARARAVVLAGTDRDRARGSSTTARWRRPRWWRTASTWAG